jgi:hypothetical protein
VLRGTNTTQATAIPILCWTNDHHHVLLPPASTQTRTRREGIHGKSVGRTGGQGRVEERREPCVDRRLRNQYCRCVHMRTGKPTDPPQACPPEKAPSQRPILSKLQPGTRYHDERENWRRSKNHPRPKASQKHRVICAPFSIFLLPSLQETFPIPLHDFLFVRHCNVATFGNRPSIGEQKLFLPS